HGDQPLAGRQRDLGDPGRLARGGVNQQHALAVVDLAEVQLEGRAGVPDRAGMWHALLTMEVSQRHVREMTGEGGRRDGITEDVRVPLTPALGGAVHGEMAHQDVDRTVVHALGELVDESHHPVLVGGSVLVRIGSHYLLHLDDAPLGDEREQGDPGTDVLQQDGPALLRSTRRPDGGDPSHLEKGRHRVDPGGVVVVAGHDHHRCDPGQVDERAPHDLLGHRRSRAGVEEIAGNEDQVHGVLRGDADDLGEHRPVFIRAVTAPDPLSYVPVGRVEDLHQRCWNGSSGPSDGGRTASSARVAHDGNGNSTTRGTGISGWVRSIVPGLRIVARCRWAPGRNPYSSRAASAESRRPTTRIDELAMIRRSTSEAVCWAPIRITPSERPRSAMSRRISLIGLYPSRGAYLFSSSRTTSSISEV